jgi:hypothetical protein
LSYKISFSQIYISKNGKKIASKTLLGTSHIDGLKFKNTKNYDVF